MPKFNTLIRERLSIDEIPSDSFMEIRFFKHLDQEQHVEGPTQSGIFNVFEPMFQSTKARQDGVKVNHTKMEFLPERAKLVDVRARADNEMDTSFLTSRWHRQMTDWYLQYKASDVAKNTRTSKAFGTTTPDGLLFVATASNRLLYPESSSSSAAGPSEPIVDNQSSSSATPENQTRKKSQKLADMHNPTDEDSLKRKTPSKSSLVENLGLSEDEVFYMVPSLVYEVKKPTFELAKMACQGFAYIISLRESCGAWLGMIVRGSEFSVVLHVADDILVVKTPADTPEQVSTAVTGKNIDQYLETTTALPFSFGSDDQVNHEHLKLAWQVHSMGIDLIQDYEMFRPLPRLRTPEGPLFSMFSDITLSGAASETTRKMIVGKLRDQLARWFIERDGRKEEAKKKKKPKIGKAKGGRPGKDNDGGDSGGGGNPDGQQEDKDPERDLDKQSGHEDGKDGDGGTGNEADTSKRQNAPKDAEDTDHTDSTGNTSTNTNSSSSRRQPWSVTDSQTLNSLRPSSTSSVDTALSTAPTSLVDSGLLEKNSPQPQFDEEVSTLLPNGWYDTDFLPEGSELFPSDEDEEGEDREFEEALHFRCNRAIMRKRGTLIIEVGGTVFNQLIEEAVEFVKRQSSN